MRIIFIGTDRTLFTPQSNVFNRLALLATTHPQDHFDHIVFSAHQHGLAKSVTLAPNARAYPTNSLTPLTYGWDAFRIALSLPRPDVVTAQDPFETGLIALIIARFFRIPFTVQIHTDFITPAFTKRSLIQMIRRGIAAFVLPRAAGGYAVSTRVRDGVVAAYHLTKPFDVLPIFVDTARYARIQHSAHPRFKKTLVWAGRFEKEKHPEVALDALAAARRNGYDVGLVMVGEGSLRHTLEAQTVAFGLTDAVEFAGWQHDMAPYYAMADLVLVTSAFEGYGMVIVEALAAGVPVLSTNVGVAAEAGAIIAEGNYANALLGWLAAPSPRGVLRLASYDNEEAYVARLRDHNASVIMSV